MNTPPKKYKVTTEKYNNLVKLDEWLKEDKDLPQWIKERKIYSIMLIGSVMDKKWYSDMNRRQLNEIVAEYNKIHGH